MSIEVNVNGIGVSVSEGSVFKTQDVLLHTLLRKGDDCEVNDDGVIYKGVVRNIIRLSKGKTLFSVELLNNPTNGWELFEDWQVTPVDPEQCALRLTAIDMLLRRYEPKGQSTNVSLW